MESARRDPPKKLESITPVSIPQKEEGSRDASGLALKQNVERSSDQQWIIRMLEGDLSIRIPALGDATGQVCMNGLILEPRDMV